jgi:hypothetical protein
MTTDVNATDNFVDDICPRCGVGMQATHHPLCQYRDGTPTELSDYEVRRRIKAGEHGKWTMDGRSDGWTGWTRFRSDGKELVTNGDILVLSVWTRDKDGQSVPPPLGLDDGPL